MPYNDLIVNLADNPEHIGSMNEDDPNVGVGEDGAPACGDLLKVYIKVDSDNNIEDVKFKIFGCGSAIASSEFMAKSIIGKNIDNIINEKTTILDDKDSFNINDYPNQLDLENLNHQIAHELKLPPIKFHCSVLAKDAISEAIKNLKEKRIMQNATSQ